MYGKCFCRLKGSQNQDCSNETKENQERAEFLHSDDATRLRKFQFGVFRGQYEIERCLLEQL